MASSVSDPKRRKSLARTAFWKLRHLWRKHNIPIATKGRLKVDRHIMLKDRQVATNAFGTSCYRIMPNIKRRKERKKDREKERKKERI